MKHFSSKTAGFTLIELLVVISIIGLLSSVVVASLNTARAKGRDASRVQTVSQIKNALELYYNDNKTYPVYPSGVAIQTLVTTDLTKYLPGLSAGFAIPQTLNSFFSNGNNYELFVAVENGASFSKNAGCNSSDYAYWLNNSNNNLYCFGNSSSVSIAIPGR